MISKDKALSANVSHGTYWKLSAIAQERGVSLTKLVKDVLSAYVAVHAVTPRRVTEES